MFSAVFLMHSNGVYKEIMTGCKYRNECFAACIACLIQDFEHPSYSNQFVVRAKYPLAIRYSDIYVLENHHLAAGF
jgi:hypothetical protein